MEPRQYLHTDCSWSQMKLWTFAWNYGLFASVVVCDWWVNKLSIMLWLRRAGHVCTHVLCTCIPSYVDHSLHDCVQFEPSPYIEQLFTAPAVNILACNNWSVFTVPWQARHSVMWITVVSSYWGVDLCAGWITAQADSSINWSKMLLLCPSIQGRCLCSQWTQCSGAAAGVYSLCIVETLCQQWCWL
jgi:hypothetical protein